MKSSTVWKKVNGEQCVILYGFEFETMLSRNRTESCSILLYLTTLNNKENTKQFLSLVLTSLDTIKDFLH